LRNFIKFDSIVEYMNTRQKLEIIQKMLGLTQTKLAEKFGVSFVAFNNWWTGKAKPRAKMQTYIDEMFLEVTGQKVIPSTQLIAKKLILQKKSKKYQNVVKEILKNPDIRDQFILKLTYHSNSIEGSTLTENETAAILFDNTAIPNKSLTEQLEAKNHQTALQYLFEHVSKKRKVDETLVLKLHSILMNGVRPDAGMFRNHGVRIVGVALPTANYMSVPKLISEVMSKAGKKTDDTLALATATHARFEQIHPFSDGNGRVGRLLMNAMLLNSNFTPAVIRQENKRLYYTYLYKAQTTENQSQLENFLCEAVMEGFEIIDRTDKR